MADIQADSTKQEKKRKPGTFLPGKSGNPGGRPKEPKEVRDAFQASAHKAVLYLTKLVDDTQANDNYRIKAAEIILDRAYGKPITSSSDLGGDTLPPLKVEFGKIPDELTDPAKQDNLELPE